VKCADWKLTFFYVRILFLLRGKIYVDYIDINGEKEALVEHRIGGQVFYCLFIAVFLQNRFMYDCFGLVNIQTRGITYQSGPPLLYADG